MHECTFDVAVSAEPIDFVGGQQRFYASLGSEAGAITSFVGTVRGSNDLGKVDTMRLECYVRMAEMQIREICSLAAQRWPLAALSVRHRFGELQAGEAIVVVMAASSGRAEAFAAVEFIMDFLKTKAPFWKLERGPWGERWLDAKKSDFERLGRWE